MIHYFDTSALVKLFSNESGSKKVQELVVHASNETVLIELAEIEILSAVYRKYRNNEISEDKILPIQQAITSQFQSFTIIPLGSDIIEESKKLIEVYGKDFGLRTLDAMHVAGWNIVSESDWIFVSSDINQIRVVEKQGNRVLLI